jgi:hypothetical protein
MKRSPHGERGAAGAQSKVGVGVGAFVVVVELVVVDELVLDVVGCCEVELDVELVVDVVGCEVELDVELVVDVVGCEVELDVELVLEVVGCSVVLELDVEVVVGDACAAAGGRRIVSTTGSIITAAADSESRRTKDRREMVDGCSGSSTTTSPASTSSASASATISSSAGRPVRRSISAAISARDDFPSHRSKTAAALWLSACASKVAGFTARISSATRSNWRPSIRIAAICGPPRVIASFVTYGIDPERSTEFR